MNVIDCQKVIDSITHFANEMDSEIPTIKDGVLTARVVGEFSAGKTRVIKEILSDQIPHHLIPISSQEAQTRLQLEISYGAESCLQLIEKTEDQDEAKPLKFLTNFPTRAEVADYDPQTHRLRLLINEPRFILPEGDGYYDDDAPKKLFIIDTPGWNSGEDDLAEVDAHQYFTGEHNLAIIYVCHANRLDGQINQKRLSNFLEVLGEALFLGNKSRLIVMITHCQSDSQQRLSDRFRQRIEQQWQELGFDPQNLELIIRAFDFEEMSQQQLILFRTQFWQDLLAETGTHEFELNPSIAKKISDWPTDWDIRPLVKQHIKTLKLLKIVLGHCYVEQQWIKGLNMTRLTGLDQAEIQTRLFDRWYQQLDIKNLDDLDHLDPFIDQHPLAQWWQDYWVAQLKPIFQQAHHFLTSAENAIIQVNAETEDLNLFLHQQLDELYQQVTDRQQIKSFYTLIELIDQKMQDLDLAEFIATLLKLSVLESRYQEHYQRELAKIEH